MPDLEAQIENRGVVLFDEVVDGRGGDQVAAVAVRRREIAHLHLLARFQSRPG